MFAQKKAKIDYRKLDQETFELLNTIRTNPKSFVPVIEKALATTQEKYKDGMRVAIDYLNSATARPALEWSDKLEGACKYHTLDIGPKGKDGHNSTDGKTFLQRNAMFGVSASWSGEILIYGGGVTAESNMVNTMCSPSHRDGAMDAGAKYIGSYSGKHR